MSANQVSTSIFRLWWRDKGQRFVLTTLDSQHKIDQELRVSDRSAKYQIIGC